MNPLNHALNTSSVSYLSVYLSTQCLFRYFSPLDRLFQLPFVQEGVVY